MLSQHSKSSSATQRKPSSGGGDSDSEPQIVRLDSSLSSSRTIGIIKLLWIARCGSHDVIAQMGAEAKEHSVLDLESGVTLASASHTSCACLPPLALLRRKKLLVLVLLLPAIYFMLIYNDQVSSPLDSHPAQHVLDALHQASPAINQLAGKLPGIAHHYDDAHMDEDRHLHNALLDKMHVQGTVELSELKDKLDHGSIPAASSSNNSDASLLQLSEMSKFTPQDESVMLLLLALKTKDYAVQDDWKAVFLERTPLQDGLFSTLNSGPTNKFTQLLATVGLPKPEETHSLPKFSILNDALQLYSLSRKGWVDRVRPSLGLTVFSKSYCPYSKKTKALLDSLNATYTVYEVDTRPDAKYLQPLLAKLTHHHTFPTILVRDRLLGGNDDLHDLHTIQALKSILASVGAL